MQGRRILGAIACTTLLLGPIGCSHRNAPGSGEPQNHERDELQNAVLTSSSDQRYALTTDGGNITASAPASLTDYDIRQVFWTEQAGSYADQEQCSTWSNAGYQPTRGPFQPGIALRIAPTGADGSGTKAITVTENIWLFGLWEFNVHVWDTTRARPLTLVETFDLSPIVGVVENSDGVVRDEMAPPPWHVCARAVGDRVGFMIWTGKNAQPSWEDSSQVFIARLPAGWEYPGTSGDYIGHLRPNQSVTFSDRTSRRLCPGEEIRRARPC